MKKIFNISQFTEIILDESFLLGIEWKEIGGDNYDVDFNIDWAGQENMSDIVRNIISTRLHCQYVFDLIINLNFDKYIGAPMIEEVNYINKSNYFHLKITFKRPTR